VLSFNITGVRVVHRHYPPESATGDATTVGVGAGAIGHHTLLRTGVNVGAGSQLAANLTVERGTHIGSGVRCSPGSHLTADTVVGDHAFIGAGVRTINDKQLIWRDPDHEVPLTPPVFGEGCKGRYRRGRAGRRSSAATPTCRCCARAPRPTSTAPRRSGTPSAPMCPPAAGPVASALT